MSHHRRVGCADGTTLIPLYCNGQRLNGVLFAELAVDNGVDAHAAYDIDGHEQQYDDDGEEHHIDHYEDPQDKAGHETEGKVEHESHEEQRPLVAVGLLVTLLQGIDGVDVLVEEQVDGL